MADTNLTPEERRQLREAAERATPGGRSVDSRECGCCFAVYDDADVSVCVAAVADHPRAAADATFCVAARPEVVLRLLAQVDALEAELLGGEMIRSARLVLKSALGIDANATVASIDLATRIVAERDAAVAALRRAAEGAHDRDDRDEGVDLYNAEMGSVHCADDCAACTAIEALREVRGG